MLIQSESVRHHGELTAHLSHLSSLTTLLELLNLLLLTSNLSESIVDLSESFTFFPDLSDSSPRPLSLESSKPYALLIEPNPLLLPGLILKLYKVLVKGLHILSLLPIVLLNNLLHLFHLLIEHVE